jgi:hypothetical protein
MCACVCASVHIHISMHSLCTIYMYMANQSVSSRDHIFSSLNNAQHRAMHTCHLTDGDGSDGMRLSTQQRTEQHRKSLPFPGPCATPESTPCCSWISHHCLLCPLECCAQHTFSKSSWFLLMKSCLSSTQCESCLTKNMVQSAFQSGTKEHVSSNTWPELSSFHPVGLPAHGNW